MSELSDRFSNLIQKSALLFGGTVLGRILGLLGHILLVRYLSPRIFGSVALAFTLVSAIGSVMVLGIPIGVVRLISASNSQEEKLDIIRNGYLISIMLGIVTCGAIIYSRQHISKFLGTPELNSLLLIFSLYLLVYPSVRISIRVMQSIGNSSAIALSRDILPKVASIAAFLVFAHFLTPYLGAVSYWIVSIITAGIFSLYYIRSRFPITDIIRSLPSLSSTKQLVSFSWPLAFEGSFMLLMTNADLLFIGYFLDASEVGLYKSIQPLTIATLFILNSATFFYLPMATDYFENGDIQDLNNLYTAVTKWVLLASFPLFMIFILFSSEALTILFPPSYSAAAIPFAILSTGMFFRVFVGPNGATIKAVDRTRVNLISSTTGVLVNLLLNIYLIPRFGIIGAATATSIGFISYNFIEVSLLYKMYGIHPFSLDTIKPLLLTLITSVALAYLLRSIRSDVVELVIGSITIVVTLLLSMLMTKSLNDFDLEILDRLGLLAKVDDRILRKIT